MERFGKWYSIAEPPKDEGVYLVANKQGTIALKIFNPILYYPFGDDPQSSNYFGVTCWAYTPELSPEFTDIDVINNLKAGKSTQIIT